jgi:hypothetical protein
MKKVLLLASAVLVLFSSCEKEVTGVTLDEANLTLEVGDTATLTATILPADAEGTVTWASSNTAVATVNNGEIIALSVGTANITASVNGFNATCVLTVNKAKVNFNVSLTGTEYYPIILDGVTAAKLGTKIKADFRPDEATKFLYIWDGTFTPGTSTGPNCFGEVEPWTSLVVGSIGWSGAGFNCKDGAALDKLAPLTANPDKYYLHIGIKSRSNATYVIALDGQSGVKFAVGPAAFNDNGTMIEPLADFPRDGEWQKIEIPLSTLKSKGLLYSTGMGEKNVLWFLAGGVAGTTIDLDALFIYKKQ